MSGKFKDVAGRLAQEAKAVERGHAEREEAARQAKARAEARQSELEARMETMIGLMSPLLLEAAEELTQAGFKAKVYEAGEARRRRAKYTPRMIDLDRHGNVEIITSFEISVPSKENSGDVDTLTIGLGKREETIDLVAFVHSDETGDSTTYGAGTPAVGVLDKGFYEKLVGRMLEEIQIK